MKLTHIQVCIKITHEARIHVFIYKQIPCSFFLYFVCSDSSITLLKAAVLNSSPRALHISYVTLIASDVCSIRT